MFRYNITSAENVRKFPCPFLNDNEASVTRVDVVKWVNSRDADHTEKVIVFKQLDSGDIQTESDQMEGSQEAF